MNIKVYQGWLRYSKVHQSTPMNIKVYQGWLRYSKVHQSTPMNIKVYQGWLLQITPRTSASVQGQPYKDVVVIMRLDLSEDRNLPRTLDWQIAAFFLFWGKLPVVVSICSICSEGIWVSVIKSALLQCRQYTLYNIHCILYIAYFTDYNRLFTLYTLYCTMYTAYCFLCIL